MAIHKARVVGQLRVADVAPGGEVELDDELVNVRVLVDGELIELIDPEPEAEPVVEPAVVPDPVVEAEPAVEPKSTVSTRQRKGNL